MAISSSLRYLVSAIAAGAVLAGCGGAQTGSPLASQPGAVIPNHVQSISPAVKGHCDAKGGVRVDPCSVDLNASNPGPDTVTVRLPKDKKGTLTESDTCGGPSGIATVTAGSDNQYTVAAGSTAGTCTATFDYMNHKGKKVLGYANLSITNEL